MFIFGLILEESGVFRRATSVAKVVSAQRQMSIKETSIRVNE